MIQRRNKANISLKLTTWLNVHRNQVSIFGIIGLALLVTFAVYWSAWVSEDCFITLRYVNNTLNGYGAVFNIGEKVYGYTHPLWFLMILTGSFILHNEILTAIALGIILNLILLLLLGHTLFKQANNPFTALIIFMLACSSFISSDIWVSFQTGGLENSLSHLLIFFVISESYFHQGERPGLLLLLISLLCLSRPDFALLSFPFAILLLPHLRSLKTFRTSLIAIIPALSWISFSGLYYGTILPNTGAAKLDLFPNWLYAIKQGIIYTADWCISDPFAAGATISLFIYCVVNCRKNKVTKAVLAGITLHLTWVIFIGGDFMRGRLLMPVLTATIIFGSLEALGRCREKPLRRPFVYLFLTMSIFAIATLHGVGNALDWNFNLRAGILNERKYYPGYSLESYLSKGHLANPNLDLTFANELQAYADDCGPITVHYRNPGTMGYLAGPEVTIIDTLGLTDRYIASLPKAYLVDPTPRPGHGDKYIPVEYLACRQDISLLPDWQKGVLQRDCSLGARLTPLKKSKQFLGPNGLVNTLRPHQFFPSMKE